MNTLRIKRGDMVRVIAGKDKGTIAKVVAVLPKQSAVKVEGINIVKRAQKPNMLNPQGGIKELHQPIDISKIAIVHPSKKDKVSKVGFVVVKDNVKKRVYKQASNKEIA